MIKKKWTPVLGKILAKNIIMKVTTGSDRSYTSYVVNVRWEYSLDGKLFEGESNGWGTGNAYLRRKDAKEKLNEYEIGSEKEIYYNPEKHWESVFALKSGLVESLIRKLGTITKAFGLVLVFFFGGGVILLTIGSYFDLSPIFIIVPLFLGSIAVFFWFFTAE